MFFTRADYKSSNEDLHNKIQEVYKKYFFPEEKYTQKLIYSNVVNYGFVDFECRNYIQTRVFDADNYVSYISTHSDHITLQEPYKSDFYNGVREVILNAGNKIVINDTIVLYLARKP
jgi:hypothetical protein